MNIKKFLATILAIFVVTETLPTEAVARVARATFSTIGGKFKILGNKKTSGKTFSNTKLSSNKGRKAVSKFKHMAGKRHEKTNILYNYEGYPIFDEVAVCNLKLPSKVAAIRNENRHFRVATKILKKAIAQGKINASQFSSTQLAAIQAESPKIPGYTWHHHQKFRKMQLVPEKIHSATGHEGGYSLWYK